jgi:D-3-phosphoglycerate dehydrogenase
MLRGKVLGIIGCGRIGQMVAHYGQAFGMRTIGYDPHLAGWPVSIERCGRLEDVLVASDFVTVHVPLNEETRGLLNAAAFEHMKPGAVFVNTSRGEVTDEVALLKALETQHLRGAGLDVLTGEPDVAAHPLHRYAQTHRNLVITPHIGGYCPETVVIAARWAFRTVCRHLGHLT